MPKILTNHDCPPIPFRGCDWSAWVDGQEEEGPVGRGPTRFQALLELSMAVVEERGNLLTPETEGLLLAIFKEMALAKEETDDPHD